MRRGGARETVIPVEAPRKPQKFFWRNRAVDLPLG